MTEVNSVKMEFLSRSSNESFARTAVACFAAQLDPTLEELGDIKTAVSEAVTNSIVHAYPDTLGKIQLRARIFDDSAIEITVRDWGCGIEDITRARAPMFTTGGDDRSGMGFTIMESFMDKLSVRSKPGRGTTVVMRPPDCHPAEYEVMEQTALDRLLAAKNGDRNAADEMVSQNSGLIWSIARRYFGRGVDPDDLYQLGCVGFLKAVAGFDPAYGTQFSTYAVPKIAGEIRRFLRDDGSIKVSRSIKERAHVIRSAKSALEQRLGREPTLSELSGETGVSAEEIAVAETATGLPESLQKETGEDGFTLENILGDWDQEENLIEQVSLREAISKLPDKEQVVIRLRYYRGMTQDQAARVLKVSQVQVSRLERRAVEALRDQLE